MRKIVLILASLFLSTAVIASENPVVRIETTMGNIDLELYPAKAPETVKNFLRYINEGFYSDTTFHRVIKRFMIQGGGYTSDYLKKKTHAPVANEAFNGLKNDRGTIAMARTNMPHSATAQFFINTNNNTPLNFTRQSHNGWGYTVFGKVTKGIETVNRIESVKTGPGGVFSTDVPQVQVVINKIEVISGK